MKNLYLLVVSLLIAGCASRYQKVSGQVDALRDEQKAIVNLEAALNEHIKAKQNYEAKLKEFEKTREQNDDKGLPIGPDFDSDLSLQEQKQLLKKNQDIIADSIYELEGQKKDIVTEGGSVN